MHRALQHSKAYTLNRVVHTSAKILKFNYTNYARLSLSTTKENFEIVYDTYKTTSSSMRSNARYSKAASSSSKTFSDSVSFLFSLPFSMFESEVSKTCNFFLHTLIVPSQPLLLYFLNLLGVCGCSFVLLFLKIF